MHHNGRLKLYPVKLKDNNVEGYEASCPTDGIRIISNGMYKGMCLDDYISLMGKDAIGTNPDAYRSYKLANKYFSQELNSAAGEISEHADGSKFFIYLFLEGKAMLNYNRGRIPVMAGESIFIPASMGEYTIKGDFKALKLYVPDTQTAV